MLYVRATRTSLRRAVRTGGTGQLLPHSTYTVRVSASGVPYVPRTVDPQVAGGSVVEDYKVSSSKLAEAPEGALGPSRRRIGLKYSVVTPANQRTTGRRGVADAYEVSGVVYMLVATAGETKWEGAEKERCERTADSFLIGPGL